MFLRAPGATAAAAIGGVRAPLLELSLTGKIGERFDDGNGCIRFRNVAAAIYSADPTAHIVIDLNSEGGEVREALRIYQLLRAHRGKTECVVKTVCMSAATAILVACDIRRAYSAARFLLHDARAPTDLVAGATAASLRRIADGVEHATNDILAACAVRCHSSPGLLQSISAAGRELSAEEALGLGLVQQIIHQPWFLP